MCSLNTARTWLRGAGRFRQWVVFTAGVALGTVGLTLRSISYSKNSPLQLVVRVDSKDLNRKLLIAVDKGKLHAAIKNAQRVQVGAAGEFRVDLIPKTQMLEVWHGAGTLIGRASFCDGFVYTQTMDGVALDGVNQIAAQIFKRFRFDTIPETTLVGKLNLPSIRGALKTGDIEAALGPDEECACPSGPTAANLSTQSFATAFHFNAKMIALLQSRVTPRSKLAKSRALFLSCALAYTSDLTESVTAPQLILADTLETVPLLTPLPAPAAAAKTKAVMCLKTQRGVERTGVYALDATQRSVLQSSGVHVGANALYFTTRNGVGVLVGPLPERKQMVEQTSALRARSEGLLGTVPAMHTSLFAALNVLREIQQSTHGEEHVALAERWTRRACQLYPQAAGILRTLPLNSTCLSVPVFMCLHSVSE